MELRPNACWANRSGYRRPLSPGPGYNSHRLVKAGFPAKRCFEFHHFPFRFQPPPAGHPVQRRTTQGARIRTLLAVAATPDSGRPLCRLDRVHGEEITLAMIRATAADQGGKSSHPLINDCPPESKSNICMVSATHQKTFARRPHFEPVGSNEKGMGFCHLVMEAGFIFLSPDNRDNPFPLRHKKAFRPAGSTATSTGNVRASRDSQ